MATSTTNTPAGGYSRASLIIDPTEGYYVAGISVVDGFVTSVTVKTTENFFTSSNVVPEGYYVPGGLFANTVTHYVTYS